MTFVSVVSQAAHRYCLESLSPAFAHVWVCTTLHLSMASLTLLDRSIHRYRGLDCNVLFDTVLLSTP